MYTKTIIKKMGRKAFIGSELIFSDTVHQFLQVLTLSHKSNFDTKLNTLDQILVSKKDKMKFAYVSLQTPPSTHICLLPNIRPRWY